LTRIAVVVTIVVLIAGLFALVNLVRYVGSHVPDLSDVEPPNLDNRVVLTRTEFTQDRVSFSVASINETDTGWDGVTIALGWGSDGVTFHPHLGELGLNGARVYHEEWEATSLFGETKAKVWLNLTDADGNTYISQGDFFTFETWGWATFESGEWSTVSIEGDAYAYVRFVG